MWPWRFLLLLALCLASGADGEERSVTQAEPRSYKSRVPSYAFAGERDEQEAQLKTNSLMLRFAESRKKLSADPYRPIYHYVNPESALNDPNGLCFWQGLWHLFYQAYPPEDPRQHWGHAVSPDLIHWRDLPYAIYPDPEERCFSGATLVEESRVIAMYHGTKVGNMLAVSSDPLLLNWNKLTGQPVIPLLNSDGTAPPYKVFDPCIWKKGGSYYSLSGGTLPHNPSGRRTAAQFLFRSQDLKSWEYLHPFVEGDQFSLVGDDGACPYFWPIGDRHLLLYYSHMSGSKYLLGDYDTPARQVRGDPRGAIHLWLLLPRRRACAVGGPRRQGRRGRHLQHGLRQTHGGLESDHEPAAPFVPPAGKGSTCDGAGRRH